MRVRRKNFEVGVRDVCAIQVRRGRRDAHIGVGWVTVLFGRRRRRRRRRRGAPRPRLVPELTLGTKAVEGARVAGGNHGAVRIRALTVDDRQGSAKRIVPDLVIVLVNEGQNAQTEVREIVSGFGSAGCAQRGCIHENEPDPAAIFDVEGIPVDDAGHHAIHPKANCVRTIRLFRGRR
jgi:hypothetical protein